MPTEEEQMRVEQVSKILKFCNRTKIRVTYGAVAGILGVIPRNVGNYLGERRVKASWVVRKESKKPSGYQEKHYHDELFKNSYVIEDTEELMDALQNPSYIPPRTLFL